LRLASTVEERNPQRHVRVAHGLTLPLLALVGFVGTKPAARARHVPGSSLLHNAVASVSARVNAFSRPSSGMAPSYSDCERATRLGFSDDNLSRYTLA